LWLDLFDKSMTGTILEFEARAVAGGGRCFPVPPFLRRGTRSGQVTEAKISTETVMNFVEADLEIFVPDTEVGIDLYIRRGSDFLLYRKADLPFTEENREHLLESGHDRIYIASADQNELQLYLEANLSQIVASSRVSIEKKSKIVYDTSTHLMEELFDDPRSSELIRRSKKPIHNTVDLILTGEEATKQLISLTAHDYYTYSHSVNVTIFAIALCERILHGDSGDDFHELGHGFLLHDLGKSQIDTRIINKPGRLDNHEWKIMKEHPENGYELLQSSDNLSETMKFIVLEHHERYGGGGYPNGKCGEEIHLFGRICCIADVFDALTTRRTYRQASSTYEALNVMRNYMKDHFDPDLLHEFVLLFEQ